MNNNDNNDNKNYSSSDNKQTTKLLKILTDQANSVIPKS